VGAISWCVTADVTPWIQRMMSASEEEVKKEEKQVARQFPIIKLTKNWQSVSPASLS